MRSLYLLKGGDGAPRGCAMVLYGRWAHAEAAVAALDGVDAFARGRGLVVHFANPRRPAPGAPAELGIAPRKLFVGRLPRDADEAALRPLFEAHGPVESLAVLRTARGASAGAPLCGTRRGRRRRPPSTRSRGGSRCRAPTRRSS